MYQLVISNTLESIESIAKTIQSILTSCALLAGGAWAFFKFRKFRENRNKLDLYIDLRYIELSSNSFLSIGMAIKNIGNTKISFKDSHKYLDIAELEPAEKDNIVQLEPGKTNRYIPQFNEHAWIEPKEELRETTTIQIEKAALGYNVLFNVTSGNLKWSTSKDIITSKENKNNDESVST